MEVQFEDESSRHPSEISSLSYQNLLEDGEVSSVPLSRRESEDSSDSIPGDYSEIYTDSSKPGFSPETPTDLSQEISNKYQEKLLKEESNRMNTTNTVNMNTTTLVNGIELNVRSFKSGRIKDDPTMEVITNKLEMMTNPASDLYTMPSDALQEHEKLDKVQKRNSLEIRNNIPIVGEAKSYETQKETGALSYTQHVVRSNIRKQSPGLACRVGDGSGSGSDREGSSSERDIDKPSLVKIQNSRPRNQNLAHPLLKKPDIFSPTENIQLMSDPLKKESSPMSVVSLEDNVIDSALMQSIGGQDVENEYDYRKIARVQNGDSYVGMRLAYANEEGELDKRSSLDVSAFNSQLLDISREFSPEKDMHHSKSDVCANMNVLQKVSEDCLTEIPLNTTDSLQDDKQTFSLSPENTECDSIEIESMNSDDDKSNMGMPMVDDGLSSSQASDNDDGILSPSSNQVHKSPTAILRHKQKTELEQEMSTIDLNKEEEALEEVLEIIPTTKTLDAEVCFLVNIKKKPL